MQVKAPTGVKSLASPLSPLSPGGDVKQEVEAKNGNRVGRMEQNDDDEEEDGEINGNEEEEEEVVPPYCQPNHKPFPPIEELQDRRYWAKLQVETSAPAEKSKLTTSNYFRRSMQPLMIPTRARTN